VSGTQRAVEHAGRDDELEYQETLKGLELKRDMESILVGTNQAKAAGDGTTNPRKTASILSWIKTNTDKGSAGGAADPSAADGTGTRTDGTQRAFTEAQLKSVLQKIWNSGGKPDTIFTGGFNKQVVLDLHRPGHAHRGYQGEEDRGLGRLLRERFRPPQRRAQPFHAAARRPGAADGDVGGRVPQRPPHGLHSARTHGDSERRQMLSEYTLVARNEKASGGVFDLTTS